MRDTLSLALMTLVVLSGCAPATLNPTLKPDRPVSRWVHGDGFVEEAREGVKVGVAFHRSGVRHLQFSVEILNESGQPMTVDPQLIQCQFSEALKPSTRESTHTAVDPEAQLRAMEAAKAREAKARSNASTMHGIFFLLDVADTIANTKKRTVEENRRVSDEQAKTYDRLERDKKNAEERIADLSARQREKEKVSLRKHTLEPGGKLNGLVEFQADASAHRKMRLRIPVGERAFEFDFVPGQ